MANHNAAQKSIRQTIKRTDANRQRMSRIRTYIRYVEESLAAGNKSEAQERLQKMQSEIMRGVRRNLFKLNTASRKISRMNARVKAL